MNRLLINRRAFLATLTQAGGVALSMGILAGCGVGSAPAASASPAPSATGKPQPPASASPSVSAPSSSSPGVVPTTRAAASPAATSAAKGLKKVRLGALSSISDSGNWMALAKGYFQDQGLNVELTRFASAAEMIAPLGAGQLDAGGGAPGVGLENAVKRGIGIRIVADKGDTSPGHGFEAILARKDLYDSGQVKGLAGLKGRKVSIASTTGTTQEAALNVDMQTVGLKARDTNMVAMSFPQMVTSFANKSVDGGSVIEPFVTEIVANGDGVILVREDKTYPNHTAAVMLYSASFAKDKPELAQAFMTGYLKGVRFYNDAFSGKDPSKRQEAIDILTKYTPVKNRALYDKMVVPGINPDGEVNIASLKQDQQYYLSAGLLKNPLNIDTLVDSSFAHRAVKALGGPYKPPA
ncbi:MAG: ABC transporter substrate-binding protein [Chloroflexota bacterium]